MFNIHSYDIGALLDKFGIAVNETALCSTNNGSFWCRWHSKGIFSFINTFQEIDDPSIALKKVKSC